VHGILGLPPSALYHRTPAQPAPLTEKTAAFGAKQKSWSGCSHLTPFGGRASLKETKVRSRGAMPAEGKLSLYTLET